MSGGEGDRIKFTIPLTPTGQMRMRAAARSIRGRHVAMVYKATKQKNREAQLAAIVSYEALKNEWEKRRGPIGLKMKAFFPIPASFSKAKKRKAERGEIFPEVTPDLSNVIKQIEDVCQDLVFDNDKRICHIESDKFYGDPARIEVEIWDLGRHEAMRGAVG